MKFDRFIAVFFMLNVILMAALAFSSKNIVISEASAELFYGKYVSASYFQKSPAELRDDGFQTDKVNFEIIFKNNHEIKEKVDKLTDLPPYEKAIGIVKTFSLMGDGICLKNADLSEKLTRSAKKEGCSKDFAYIFTALASYSGLDARIVSNGTHFGGEVWTGESWVYIDPYFAMSVSDEDSPLSYTEFSEKMINNGWMRFNYFGGKNHCMYGKPLGEHPYFGDKNSFASVYSLNGSNVFEIVKAEIKYVSSIVIKETLLPYKNGKPELIYTDIADSQRSLIRKYVTGFLAMLAVLFLCADIILPAYYLTGLAIRLSGKK